MARGRAKYRAMSPVVTGEGFAKPANASIPGLDFFEPIKFVDPQTTTEAAPVDEASKLITYSSNTSLTNEDHFVGVDTSASAVTITLPALNTISSGKQLVIKDEGGNAGNNNITIRPAVSDGATIDGNQTVEIVSNFGALNLYYNGSGWHIY
tara:strand:- start:886 stop:1341 length:456 start_codon:yes stop_codon:yes gene_type:complete